MASAWNAHTVHNKRRLLSRALLVIAVSSGRCRCSSDDANAPPYFPKPVLPDGNFAIEQLPVEHLAKLLAIELTSEEKRPAEKLQSYHEFQALEELDCQRRLLLLMNRTIELRDSIREYHTNVAGLAGLYVQLLSKAPAENSWVWLVLNSRERVAQKVHGHWSKLATIALDRQECLMTETRRTLLEAVVEWKALHSEVIQFTWNGFAFSSYGDVAAAAASTEGLPSEQVWSGALVANDKWISRVREWFDNHTQSLFFAMERELPTTALLSQEAGASRLHHQDEQGMFVPYEYLRRKAFGQWALDKGLLRGLLRHVWRPPFGNAAPVSVADFGAGGGQYSTWLNETGLVEAFAFDGTKQAAEITGGAVQEINLIQDTSLWRTFDWVMCLEVGEHIPKQFSSALLRNLRRHVVRGLVMSWSDDWEGIGHVNCLSKEDFIEFVERETDLRYDRQVTEAVKMSCEIDYIARTLAVFKATV